GPSGNIRQPAWCPVSRATRTSTSLPAHRRTGRPGWHRSRNSGGSRHAALPLPFSVCFYRVARKSSRVQQEVPSMHPAFKAILSATFLTHACSGRALAQQTACGGDLGQFLAGAKAEAQARGVTADVADRALAGASIDQKVLSRDRAQGV